LWSEGYGDIHAVNVREMIFVMIYVSFDMVLGAYLIGTATALIVKGSRTERFRDRMKEVIRYMNRNKLGKEIREQIKEHLRLQYESSYTEVSILQDIPISIRAKVTDPSVILLLEMMCSCKVPVFDSSSEAFSVLLYMASVSVLLREAHRLTVHRIVFVGF
jgi:potassium channel